MGLGLLDARDFLSSIYSCNRVQLDLAQAPRGYPAVGLAFVIAAAGWMASGAIGARADSGDQRGLRVHRPITVCGSIQIEPPAPKCNMELKRESCSIHRVLEQGRNARGLQPMPATSPGPTSR